MMIKESLLIHTIEDRSGRAKLGWSRTLSALLRMYREEKLNGKFDPYRPNRLQDVTGKTYLHQTSL